MRYKLCRLNYTNNRKYNFHILKRGIYNSMIGVPSLRANLNARKNVLEKVKEVCRITSANMKYLQTNEEMRRRTFVVRYEDIAVKPFQYAKQILNFAGLNYTSEVDDWIVENTQGNIGRHRKTCVKS